MSNTEELARAWDNLPAQFRAHPGIKALHRAALAQQPAASGEPVAHLLTHLYRGDCPDDNQPHSRDPECRACRAMDAAAHPAPARVPLTQSQMRRLYDNSPQFHCDVTSRYGFYRIVMLAQRVHGITENEAPAAAPDAQKGEP